MFRRAASRTSRIKTPNFLVRRVVWVRISICKIETDTISTLTPDQTMYIIAENISYPLLGNPPQSPSAPKSTFGIFDCSSGPPLRKNGDAVFHDHLKGGREIQNFKGPVKDVNRYYGRSAPLPVGNHLGNRSAEDITAQLEARCFQPRRKLRTDACGL